MQIVALLLQYSASVTKKNQAEFTALMLARMNGHTECVQLLQQAEKQAAVKAAGAEAAAAMASENGRKLNKDYVSMAADYRSQQQYRDAGKGVGTVSFLAALLSAHERGLCLVTLAFLWTAGALRAVSYG